MTIPNIILPLCVFLAVASALWPVPVGYTPGNDVLWIDQSVQITYAGAYQVSDSDTNQHPLTQWLKGFFLQNAGDHTNGTNNVISTAISRTKDTLFNKNIVPWKFHERNTDFEPAANGTKQTITSIVLQQNGTDAKDVLKPLDGDVDESYSLSVTSDGRVSITAPSSIGLAHGLTTFTQLFYKHSAGGVYTNLAPIQIYDKPKFQHRGLNMDVSRSYYPPADILRTIDALSYTKMNRLHIHATDSQSWPLEIPSLPELAGKGAYHASQTYTPADLQSIQQYGAARGVEVIIEIDMPGHTSSIWFSHPDLIAAFNQQPDWNTYAAEPPSGTLKLNSSAVTSFLDTLFADLLPRVSPYSNYFHTGGDEVNPNAYLLDDTVRSNSTSIIQPLMQSFVSANHARVRSAGLTPIVWEEMLLQWNLTLGSDVIVQTWQSDAAVALTVSQGHKALAGNYEYWYLDCGQGQWLNFGPYSAATYYPYADYCSPRKNWKLVYQYDPLQGVPGNASHLVLGGEVHIWSETTDPVNLDRQVWPRAAAAAEVLWSGAKDEVGRNRSLVDAAARLGVFRERLVAAGVGSEPVHMVFCTMNETNCVL